MKKPSRGELIKYFLIILIVVNCRIISERDNLKDEGYLSLFDFEMEPHLFFIESQGKLVILENKDNQRDTNPEFF